MGPATLSFTPFPATAPAALPLLSAPTAMHEFLVHFQDDRYPGKTVLRSFARHMSLSEARARLLACYPLRAPHCLSITHLAPLLPGR
ncbi:hypothetical protein D3C76_490290 [compost metagenome]